jgi:outer membrane protein assembly factor BamB
VVRVQNQFRLRIEADEALQNRMLTFVDSGDPQRESSLAVLVQWSDRTLKPALHSVFEDFVRDYREAGSIVSPGAFLESLVQTLDAACAALEPERLASFEVGVVLSCGRGLYLLHSTGLGARYALDTGEPQALQSSMRVRVKDLSPGTMRQSHLWSERVVERLRLVRVFFEDDVRATLWLEGAPAPASDLLQDLEDPLESPAAPSIVVDKEPALASEVPGDLSSTWPDLDEAPRRDRRTLSYAAVGLVVLLFGTALFGMWRWQRIGSHAPSASGTEALLSESPDSSLEPRQEDSRVSGEVVDGEGSRKGRDADDDLRMARLEPQEPGELSIVWSRKHKDWVTSSPRLAQGRVVYGCRDGHLYAVAPDGQVQWDYDSGAGIGATPAVDGDRIFCGNYSGRAFAVRGKDGAEAWSVELGARIVASPSAGKKHVFFATQAGEVVALRKKDGREAWRYAVGGKLRSTPLAAGDDVFVAGSDGEMLCLEQGSGKMRWVHDVGSPVQSSPVLVDGRLLFGCKNGTVCAVSAKKGEPLWTLETKGAVSSTPAPGKDLVYVGSSDRRLYAVRPQTGDVAWSFPVQAAILSTPTVRDGKVYVTAYDKHTYVLDAKDGRQLAKLRLKAPIYSSPLVAEGRIYCGSNDGTLYCMSDVARN